MIAATDLRKRYADRDVLAGLSFRFERGSIAALIGPSGAGKSTLLRCVNGLESFDGGSLSVVGETLFPGSMGTAKKAHLDHNAKALARIRLRVGFVFQHFNLFAHRSALGNVAEGLIVVRGMTHGRALGRAEELLAQVGLSHRALAYPHEMSGGEQQRTAIARALAMDPEVLLLDEPTSALDPERVGEVLEVLRNLAARGLTMLIATHEMDFAREVASRVLVLDGGRIIEDGSPSRVFDQPETERTGAFLARTRPR